MTSWSRRLPDWQGWDQQYPTLSVVQAEGSVWPGGGLAGGIVLHRAEPNQSPFGRYSYVNNTDNSSLPDWNPNRYASQLSFANIDGGRNDPFVMVKPGGLFAAPIVKTSSMGAAIGDRKRLYPQITPMNFQRKETNFSLLPLEVHR
jgi:hypothetical protein